MGAEGGAGGRGGARPHTARAPRAGDPACSARARVRSPRTIAASPNRIMVAKASGSLVALGGSTSEGSVGEGPAWARRRPGSDAAGLLQSLRASDDNARSDSKVGLDGWTPRQEAAGKPAALTDVAAPSPHAMAKIAAGSQRRRITCRGCFFPDADDIPASERAARQSTDGMPGRSE